MVAVIRRWLSWVKDLWHELMDDPLDIRLD